MEAARNLGRLEDRQVEAIDTLSGVSYEGVVHATCLWRIDFFLSWAKEGECEYGSYRDCGHDGDLRADCLDRNSREGFFMTGKEGGGDVSYRCHDGREETLW